MNYLTCKQASEKWGLTVRRVQALCKNGEIPGTVRHGREWLIPQMAIKPDDKRKGVKIQLGEKQHNVDNSHILSIFTAYQIPGTAEAVLETMKNYPMAYDMFKAHICFYRGEVQQAKSLALKYTVSDAPLALKGFISTALSLCASVLGDEKLWNQAGEYLDSTVCKDIKQQELLDFWKAANASILSDFSAFPPWFRRGDFGPLPKASYPMARFFYARYMYLSAHEASVSGVDDRMLMMNLLPMTIEPLISQTKAEGVIVSELYLRLVCAVAYHAAGEDELAKGHIEKVVELALPDRFYLPIAEYMDEIGALIGEVLEKKAPNAFAEVKKIHKSTHSGWIKLHNKILNRTVFEGLSKREREISRLAVYGLSNKEIADRLGISVNAVKQTLHSAMCKTGAENRKKLYRYV